MVRARLPQASFISGYSAGGHKGNFRDFGSPRGGFGRACAATPASAAGKLQVVFRFGKPYHLVTDSVLQY
jgi:hypothetical protein